MRAMRYDHIWTIADVRQRSDYIRVSYHEAVTAYVNERRGIVEYAFYDATPARATDYAQAVGATVPVRRDGTEKHPRYVVVVPYANRPVGNRTAS